MPVLADDDVVAHLDAERFFGASRTFKRERAISDGVPIGAEAGAICKHSGIRHILFASKWGFLDRGGFMP
jgi:hypothetical protein